MAELLEITYVVSVLLFIRLRLAYAYEPDAIQDWRHFQISPNVNNNGIPTPASGSTGSESGSANSVSGFSLDNWEYFAWLSYTLFSVGLFSILGYWFRSFLARLVTCGLRNIRSVRVVVEVEGAEGRHEIMLGGCHSYQVPQAAIEGVSGGEVSLRHTGEHPRPESADLDQYHDCSEI